MTTDEFKSLRDQLGLTTYALGPVLGVSRQQAYKYANGKQKVPGPIAILLRMLVEKAEIAGETNGSMAGY